MFQVNDVVLYGSEGVCRIEGVMQRDFNGLLTEYCVLRPVYSEASTIYIPVENETLLKKMKRVLTAEEVHEMIQSIPDEVCIWIQNENERRETYRRMLSDGDRKELIRLIKTLYFHQREQLEKGKRLHISDERFLKEAEKMLYDEFAVVLQIQREQVLPYILEQIQAEENGIE